VRFSPAALMVAGYDGCVRVWQRPVAARPEEVPQSEGQGQTQGGTAAMEE
jgi:hypothetical protein